MISMPKRLSISPPELYIKGLDKLEPKYGSRDGVVTIAVKKLLQYEMRVGHLNASQEKRLFYNV